MIKNDKLTIELPLSTFVDEFKGMKNIDKIEFLLIILLFILALWMVFK